MSERIQSRIDNFDANKAAAEEEQFEDSLYGEAGATDFSDDARTRLGEASAYEQHLESLKQAGSVSEDEYYDSQVRTDNSFMENAHDEALAMNAEHDAAAAAREAEFEQKVQSSPQVRRMELIAADVARINASEVNADTEARMTQAAQDKQDKLAELLVRFDEQSTEFTAEERERIMARIIDMTERPAGSNSDQSSQEAATAQESLLPNYSAEEIDRRLEAVRRVSAEQEQSDADTTSETETEVEAEVSNEEPLSTEGIEDIQIEDLPEAPAREGESQEEYEARNSTVVDGEPLSADDIEDIATEDDEQTDAATTPRSRRRRIADAFSTAGISSEAQRGWAWTQEKLGKHPKAKLALGAVAVAGVVAAIWIAKDGGDAANAVAPKSKQGGGGEGIGAKAHELFGNGSVDVRNGEGYTQVLDRVLDSNNVHLSPQELSNLHEHLEHTQGSYIDLAGANDTYTMADGSTGLNRSDSDARISKKVQKAAVRWLQNRGKLG